MEIIDKNFLYTFTLAQAVLLGLLNVVTFKKINPLNMIFEDTISTFKNLRNARKKV